MIPINHCLHYQAFVHGLWVTACRGFDPQEPKPIKINAGD